MVFSHIFTSPSVSQVVDEGLSLIEFEKKINVPDSYYGPRLSFPLTVKDANALLHAFRNEQNGLPSEQNRYVFNGDFVDRGQNSMEILIILFAFLLIYPNDLHLNRGNHEDYIMNLRYGFTKEVSKKYKDHGKQILGLLQDVFSWLPLATIIDSKVLILHGGISDSTDLDFLNTLERNKLKSLMRPPKSVRDGQDQAKERIPTTSKHIVNQNVAGKTQRITSSGSTEPSGSNLPPEPTLKEWKQILDILWSDPRSQNGCTPNKCRGGGCYFGPDVTAKLFKKYNLKMLIRSHEFKPEGYEISHGGKVITIFSASNYYEEGSNRGAYIKLNPELIPRFVQYRVSKYTRRQNLRERVGTIESSALKSLRETIYAHRAELTSAFAKYDLNGTGNATSLSSCHRVCRGRGDKGHGEGPCLTA
ncbi:serine threonine-protein phosphatase with ef-hands 1 [Limosa lapponica baueri]|uniref:Serine/threonine-protein phosphatase n=1 Tax=Limosa lapponica baueri TaxID=1758121 RepID=A0A2I0TDM2_LIMLA|nr:serine threonine-protein phosphatase with ef-hands 1 [Limosa lapponica baueri]